MFGSLACLPFPSALLSMLIPVKPIAELPKLYNPPLRAFQVVHIDFSNGMLSSKFKCLSKILEGGSQNVETPLPPPPKRPSQIGLIYISIDSP